MSLVGAGVLLVLLAAAGSLLLGDRRPAADRLVRVGIPLGCGVALWPALRLLLAAEAVPTGGNWFGLDRLSAWFLILVLGVGGVIAHYGVTYLAPERGHRPVGRAHLLLALLLAALAGVMTARNVTAFLTAWEIMAISAWLLVIFEIEQAEVRRAGFVYLVLTHASTLALFGMFAAWSGGAADRSFDALAASPAVPSRPGLILLLALVGFGIKAGMVPVHFWLPGAHAAAPSHISALLSGVMLKTGIYGLLRVLALVGTPPAWWGWCVLLLGLVSSVLGVVWALGQHDLKRLLAYHSVENIGIILLGIGVGALGLSYGQPAVVLLGISGALLHSMNHALFKSLLFLGAGAVAHATGTREIARLGGLSRTIPRTATLFLLGSIAIVGLPPLNGFVSEWLVFHGLLQAGTAEGPLRAAAVVSAGLALTGALALACFTKLHGTLFLGTLRDPASRGISGGDQGLIAPQVVLAALCLAVGLLPAPILGVVTRTAGLVAGRTSIAPELSGASQSAAVISLMAAALIGLTVVIWAARQHRLKTAGTQIRETWGCGYPRVTSRMQYSAASFAASLLGAFGSLSGSRIVTGPDTLHVVAADPVLDRVGRPVWNRVRRTAASLRVLQMGRLWWYLLYAIFTLLVLLLYLWKATAR